MHRKTELHCHLESCTNPYLAFTIAQRNGIVPGSAEWPWNTPEELIAALKFGDLESFLQIYYAVSDALRTPQDFVDQASYAAQMLLANNVRHGELFFDPQTFTARGIPFQTVVDGLNTGLDTGRAKGLSVRLIVSILRDSPVGSPSDAGDPTQSFADMAHATAWASIKQAVAYNSNPWLPPSWRIVGVGLDSAEIPFAPRLFKDVYAFARQNGLLATAHAGEEGPASYIWEALDMLKCSRIDHGVHAQDDPSLVSFLATPCASPQVINAYGEPHKIPITCCPMSNYRLQVFPNPSKINIGNLHASGVMVTINSDDPMYTSDLQETPSDTTNWVNASYRILVDFVTTPLNGMAQALTLGDFKQIIINGFEASWIPRMEKNAFISNVNAYFLSSPGCLYDYLLQPAIPRPIQQQRRFNNQRRLQ